MKLNKAIQTVAKFAAKGKDAPELYKAIHFFPGYVFATDGLISSLVPIAVELPQVSVLVAEIAPVARQELGSVTFSKDELSFVVQDGGVFKVPILKTDVHPHPPTTIPEDFEEYPYWNSVISLLHAAAEEKSKNVIYKSIAFKKNTVETTDGHRVAVVDAPGIFGGTLLPAKLFKYWKVGRLTLQKVGDVVWCQMGSELRCAPITQGVTFPDCRNSIPMDCDWPYCAVDTKELTKMVHKAVSVSKQRIVCLELIRSGVKVYVKAENGFQGQVAGTTTNQGSAVKLLNGKYLLQTLKALKTPNVRICFDDNPDAPIRVESGAMVVGIWPWRE